VSDNDGRYVGGHAIVLGASLAGMLSAAALARHVDRVTVIERDELVARPQWRRGVPQARHAHNLMTAGHRAMDRLLPGIVAELRAAGMVRVRMPEDMLLLTAGGWMPRFTTGLEMMTSSRDLIDVVVRRRIAAHPRISLLDETEVLGLEADKSGAGVRAVLVRRRSSSGTDGWGASEKLSADFVVDATGRTSRASQWLAELGYQAPRESVVDAKTAYATCVFEPPRGHSADWNCILLQATPDDPVQGILNPIEDGRWMVSLAALGGARPPTDYQGFLSYAKNLRSPVLYEVLRDAKPLTPVYRSGRTENRRRHFERLRRWPERFLVLGDAVCALNPSYGQGMSVSASCAGILDQALESRGSLDRLADSVRRAMARPTGQAWQLATTADLAYPGLAADAAWPVRMMIRYLYRVIAVSPDSKAASRALLDINQMVAPPQAMFRPRVLAAAARGPRRAAPLADPPSAVFPS
jgi:2-polyprenyl-6-methoxyphenol hydroxylase-like FAD-dependent oxidoreductase